MLKSMINPDISGKKTIYIKTIILLLVASLVVFGCGSGGEKKNAKSDSKLGKQIDPTKLSKEKLAQIKAKAISELGEKQQKAGARLDAGEITEEECEKLMREYTREYKYAIGEKILTDLPSWAKKTGLTEPEGMKIDDVESSETSVDNPIEGFNSIHLVYTGDYDKAMNEAKIIAEKADIPMGETFQRYLKIRKDLKGIQYDNHTTKSEDFEYSISIIVDDKGRLTISVTNAKQMMKVLEKYKKKSDD